MEILDSYIKSVPTIQNALDIFTGEWATRLPRDLGKLGLENFQHFVDPRIQWSVEKIGGIQDKIVLELGPLEAGHTYMLEKLGAKSIVAVEANTRAYLKCLIIKEIMGLNKAKFLCGDFIEYLKTNPGKFDFCVASGVLYHTINPPELIELISKISNKVFIWTHYYDQEYIEKKDYLPPKFSSSQIADYKGFKHTLYRYEYLTALDSAGFCGGSNSFSYWMSKDDIFASLNYFGFSHIETNFVDPEHPNGPCLGLVAISP